MKFYDHPDTYAMMKSRKVLPKGYTYADFYNETYKHVPQMQESVAFMEQLVSERKWYDLDRPYYNVWPCLLKSILRLDLSSVPVDSVSYPHDVLLLRLPEGSNVGGFEHGGVRYYIKSILASWFKFDQPRYTILATESLMFWVDIGEVEANGCNVTNYRRIPTKTTTSNILNFKDANETMRRNSPSVNIGVPVPQELLDQALKIVIACGLLCKDSGLIVPDVLNADKDRVTDDNIQRLHERAKKRGKYGWNIGESLEHSELSPHFRAPHPAIYWVGPGRKQAVIRFRTGEGGGPIIVKRNKIIEVPTGYSPDNG